jgi:hypothetical protein
MTTITRRTMYLMLLLALTFGAAGEIERFARPGTSGLDFVWWPRFPLVMGWVHDDEASWRISSNVLLPRGQTFAQSPVMIYGSAIYKPNGSSKTLPEFIAADQEGFKQRSPEAQIAKLTAERDGDGNSLPTFSFTPKAEGDWEVVAYGEEGDYFLVFVVSARNETELRKAMPVFRAVIAGHHAAAQSNAG